MSTTRTVQRYDINLLNALEAVFLRNCKTQSIYFLGNNKRPKSNLTNKKNAALLDRIKF
jgi:hypothetical protein